LGTGGLGGRRLGLCLDLPLLRVENDARDAERFGGLLVLRTDVAGGHEDGKAWTEGEELAREIEAGHAGQVGDHGSEVIGARAEIVEGGVGIDVAGYLVAQALKQVGAEHDEAFLVIDVGYVFLVAAPRGEGEDRGRSAGGSLDGWEIEMKRGALARAGCRR